MAVESLQCPNCGASLSIDQDATSTECTFCGSTLRITEDSLHQKVAEITSRPMRDTARDVQPIGQPSADDEPIRQLLTRGNTIAAIKLYRTRTGVSLREAKDAVEAIERGLPPALRSQASSQVSRASWLGCLWILGAIAACGLFIGLSSQVVFRAFGPLDLAIDMARRNPRIVEALGEPINPGLFIFGEISSGGRSSRASFEVPIFGSKKGGMLNAVGISERGAWDLSVWVYYDQAGEEVEIHMTSGP